MLPRVGGLARRVVFCLLWSPSKCIFVRVSAPGGAGKTAEGRRGMTRLARALRVSGIGVLVAALTVPAPVLAAPAALGTARGVRSAELSLDGGTNWLSLEGRSLPLMSGARIRSTTGAVAIELIGGSRLDLMPFSAASFGASGEVALEYGRVAFRLTPGSRLALPVSGTRMEPAGGEPATGEAVAGTGGAAGVRVTHGSLRFHEPGSTPRLVRAGGGPVA